MAYKTLCGVGGKFRVDHGCDDQKFLGMLRRIIWSRLNMFDQAGVPRRAQGWPWLAAICAPFLVCLLHSSLLSEPLAEPSATKVVATDEPIMPIPEPPAIDPLKTRLGERLFSDPRLSHDNSHSCASCHDLSVNGASKSRYDAAISGSSLPLNTPTVFNASLNFRFGWEGKIRSIGADVKASLQNPEIMGANISELAQKLDADPGLHREFIAAYGRGPDADTIVDALASFQRTLVTPDSKFDRWLEGDASALSVEEQEGYRLFKSLGCVSCHQGVNIGGNLFERHGIFRPLASPKPEILRVPSLRNVAATAPYFHDGSTETLDDAVRKMGVAQLDSTLTDEQVKAIVAYLQTLTGKYRGVPVRGFP
jgi:cytochrome c peroxidase